MYGASPRFTVLVRPPPPISIYTDHPYDRSNELLKQNTYDATIRSPLAIKRGYNTPSFSDFAD